MLSTKLFVLQIIFDIYVNKYDLALNNLQKIDIP